jgi:hypothetical protein
LRTGEAASGTTPGVVGQGNVADLDSPRGVVVTDYDIEARKAGRPAARGGGGGRLIAAAAGGTLHVVALGVVVVLASRIPGFGKRIRVFAYVAAVPALVSVVSLVWFNGSVFILLGRLLCMIWIVVAAVSVSRRLSRDAQA